MADERERTEAPAAKSLLSAGAEGLDDQPLQKRGAAPAQDAIARFISRHLRTLKGLSKR